MSDHPYPDRFPADAPVVPNDAWRSFSIPAPPRYCGRFGRLTRRRHRWFRPEPSLFRQECLHCSSVRYTVPSTKWADTA